jgi:hypothetical protein
MRALIVGPLLAHRDREWLARVGQEVSICPSTCKAAQIPHAFRDLLVDAAELGDALHERW